MQTRSKGSVHLLPFRDRIDKIARELQETKAKAACDQNRQAAMNQQNIQLMFKTHLILINQETLVLVMLQGIITKDKG